MYKLHLKNNHLIKFKNIYHIPIDTYMYFCMDSDGDRELRVACSYNHKECMTYSNTYFSCWMLKVTN